jgi:hypothetical protein
MTNDERTAFQILLRARIDAKPKIQGVRPEDNFEDRLEAAMMRLKDAMMHLKKNA